MDLREMRGAPTRRHPWETARLAFFTRVLGGAGAFAAPRTVLDVGAGDGWLSGQLLRKFPQGSSLVCWDVNYNPEQLAALPDAAPRQQFTAAAPRGSFDVILLLDVLEHLESDQDFLAPLVARHLRPGGYVLASVPAWPFLYGAHDRHLLHFRRYRPGPARALLTTAGLTIQRCGGLFHVLLVARAAQRLVERFRPPATAPADLGDWSHGRATSAIVDAALRLEGSASLALARAGVALPGLSWWALCSAPAREPSPRIEEAE